MTRNTKPAALDLPEMDMDSVWQAFSKDLRRHLQRKVPVQDADDVLQEIFLALMDHPAPDGVPVASWVWSLVRNYVANYYRKRGTDWEELPEEAVSAKTEEVTQAEAWVATWLTGYVAELPEPYAQALRMADFQGEPMRVIAETQGISLSGAKSRVQRARLKLAKALKDCCAFYFDEQGRIESWRKRHDTACECSSCAGKPVP